MTATATEAEPVEPAERTVSLEQYAQLQDTLELAAESLAAMQLAAEDLGWTKLLGSADREFTREGFQRNADIGRVLAVGNPLVKRALSLRHAYIWGQGIGITARADGTKGLQDVNAVVQDYLDDDRNRAAFTGSQASERLEKALGTDGNVFLANFTKPLTGKVQTRTLPFDEIQEIIYNPEDRSDPWFYKRVFTKAVLNPESGKLESSSATIFYPAITYRPQLRARAINGSTIMWDAPVYHVKANPVEGWKYGVGDVYASAPWVRAYKEYLEDWATLMRSLSRIAWQIVADKKSGAQQMRTDAARAQSSNPNNPGGAGATVTMAGGKLEAVPKSGATLDSESGRPLAAMAAAGFGLPVTMLLADPGVTGARATAATLDLPTRLELQSRRELWTECRRAILGYVIDQAVIAPQGPLRGSVKRDDDRLLVELPGEDERTLDIVWPELDETPIDLLVKAIAEADGTGKIPPLVTAQLLLRALGLRDVDEILESMQDAQGNWSDPNASAGDNAVRAYRDGRDPNQDLAAADNEIEDGANGTPSAPANRTR